MIEFLVWVTVGMAAAFAALVVTIFVGRFLSDRRRGREAALRPEIEVGLVEYLAAEDPEPPRLPVGAEARALLRSMVLEMIGELQGRERERLVALMEQVGIVAETAAQLAAGRRRTRRAAAEALRQLGSEQAATALEVGIADPDLDTSLTCAAALAELSGEERIPPIVDLAEDAALARPGAVAAILVTLGRRHPEAISEALAPARKPELQRLGAAVAGELRLAGEVPALQRSLRSSDDELVARAARGLGKIGDDGAVEVLLDLVEPGDRAWFVRLAATDALGAIGDPRAVEPLERELSSANWVLQAKAAGALRMLGAGGEEALRQALASPLATVRDHAKVALER
jgi:HEAT repeat protein